MRTRILKPEEWAKLEKTELPVLLPYVEPQNISIVVVEEEDGRIVASLAAMRITHFEGLWIDPEYHGNAGVGRSLMRGAVLVPKERGEKFVFGAAADSDEHMDDLCRRVGGSPIRMKFYPLRIGD